MVLFYTNSHFQYISVPFERISLISSVLLCPGGGALEFCSHVHFCLGARGFAAFFARGVRISPPLKNSPGGREC